MQQVPIHHAPPEAVFAIDKHDQGVSHCAHREDDPEKHWQESLSKLSDLPPVTHEVCVVYQVSIQGQHHAVIPVGIQAGLARLGDLQWDSR